MENERRANQRYNTHLAIRWEGMAGTTEAHLDDISMGGCFINTWGEVELAEILNIEVHLPSGDWLPLRGEVTSNQPGIGFGLVFSFRTEDEEKSLKELIRVLEETR